MRGEGVVPYDRLTIATGWNYADPGVPGAELDGIYEVKNIRHAMDWDKYLDTVKSAVIVECGPIAVEMVSALVHRGIKTTVVDPNPWPMADVIDPEIVEPVRKSWEDAGVDMQWGNKVTAFHGNGVPDKQKAFSEIYRILKQGAHFCVSDIVLKGELPAGLKKSAEMYCRMRSRSGAAGGIFTDNYTNRF